MSADGDGQVCLPGSGPADEDGVAGGLEEVALMEAADPLGWDVPDGTDPREFWHVDRGVGAHQMRTRFEVPADRDFVVGDIKINGREIAFGAQIADFIRVKLVGLAHAFGQHASPARDCEGFGGMAIAGTPPPSPASAAASGSARILGLLAGATR